jgi:hypothetical protein
MSSRSMRLVLVLSSILYALPGRAEQAESAPNPQPIADWTPHLNDLQSADKARQEAAAKVFVESGSRGYAVLASLLKHTDPEVVKRVSQIRAQIDARSNELYHEAAAEQAKLQHQPLTTAALEKVRQAFLRMAAYASQNPLKQLGYQNVTELQKTAKEVEAAGQQLAALDAQLKEAKGLARAGLQVERAAALKTLQRDADMLAAAQDAAQNSGKEGRFTPAALKLQAEAYQRLEDSAKLEAVCHTILAEYPRSLETKFAHQSLLSLLSDARRWDDAVRQAQAFFSAFPVDQEAQEAVCGLLENLMNEERDYARAGPLAEWLVQALPPDRLNPEALKYSGGCAEYVSRDFAKAERAYTLLRDRFADAVSTDDMNAALSRVRLKGEGKFPKEPRDTDAGLAGVFARFLKAARTRDAKALESLVPKDDVKEFIERLGDTTEELVPTLVFADFILKKADTDDAAGKGKLLFDYFEASSDKPKPLTQEAVKEDGLWKICWQDPEEEKAAAGTQAPAAKTVQPQLPSPEARK